MLVLYGSQTGTAQDVAEMIYRKLIRKRLTVTISAIDDYQIGNIVEENVIIFVVATTGQGEPTDNMKRFWKLLWRKSLPNDCFINLKFAVAGLGDSSYQKYNFVAKKLHKRLLQLSGYPLLPCALADEQHPYGYTGAITPWLDNLMEKINEIYPSNLDKIPDDILLPPKYNYFIKPFGNPLNDIVDEFAKLNARCGPKDNQKAFVIFNERLTALDHWQDVRLITLKLNSTVEFTPGDVCKIWPQNSDTNISDFLSLFNLDGKDHFFMQSENYLLDTFSAKSCTLECLVKNFVDLNGQPHLYFWELMNHFAKDDMEKEKFAEFLSLEGQEELYSYCHRPKRTILEVLNDFVSTTTNVDIAYLLDLIPAIRPRSFSIASAPDNVNGEFQLLVAVVEYKTKMKKLRKGLCSNFLANLKKSDELFVQIERTQFKFSTDLPLIMIGPGTGVAPFRSIIKFRTSKNIGDNYLFFGCRNKSKDFFFENEWNELEGKGLLRVFTAFSRDQVDKIYVQNLLSDQKELIWSLIEKNACIYVAGSSKNMPDQVEEAIKEVMVSMGHMTLKEAEELIQSMQKCGKYQMETWS